LLPWSSVLLIPFILEHYSMDNLISCIGISRVLDDDDGMSLLIFQELIKTCDHNDLLYWFQTIIFILP
jgi:hypothetical protein